MEIILVIYIVGFIANYILCKYLRNKDNDNTLKDILMTFLISLASWIAFIWIGCLTLRNNGAFETFFDKRLPKFFKWL